MSIEQHNKDYRQNAFEEYTIGELAMWVHLLEKRAGMRANPEKHEKDLYDAANYRQMLVERISMER